MRLCYLYSLDFEYKIILYSLAMRKTERSFAALAHWHHSISAIVLHTSRQASLKWLTIEHSFSATVRRVELSMRSSRQSTRMLSLTAFLHLNFYCPALCTLSIELNEYLVGPPQSVAAEVSIGAPKNRYLAQILIWPFVEGQKSHSKEFSLEPL